MTAYVKVVADDIYRRFMEAGGAHGWGGTLISSVRHGPLEVGGRTRLTLFTGQGEQSRPRLQLEALPVVDPRPLEPLWSPLPSQPPTSAAELSALVAEAVARDADLLDAEDLAPGPGEAVQPGERYRQNSVAARRKGQLFTRARELLDHCRTSARAWSASGSRPPITWTT